MRQEKGKKEGRREREKYPEILLSGHVRTSQANILHLDQKAAKVRPVNGFVVSFSPL